MKKLILTLVASLALVSAAQADNQATFVYGNQKDDTTHALTDVLMLDLKTSVFKYTDADLLVINKTAVGKNVVTNRYEGGITVTYPLVDAVSVYIRPSVGYKQKSGAEGFYYYTSEEGIKLKLPYDFSATVGYQYRNSFDTGNKDQLGTMRYYLGYNVTPKDKIILGKFQDISGYNCANTYWAGYTHSF
jgi:hypothetical protein